MRNKKTGLQFVLENDELQILAEKLYASTMAGASDLLTATKYLKTRDQIISWAAGVKNHFNEHQDMIIAIQVLNANLLSDAKQEEEKWEDDEQ